jgi:zinc and cadmium transporter
VGLLALFFLERFFSFHHHEAPASRPAPGPGKTPRAAAGTGQPAQEGQVAEPPLGAATGAKVLPWGSAAFGLAIHSLVGGIALASAVVADYRVGRGASGAGLGVFVATLVHKPADALTITSLMVRSGSARWSTHLLNLGFALMIPAGVALFFAGTAGSGASAPGAWTAGALAFSAGTFLCIALSDLLPELQFHSHDRFKLSTALLAGFLVMAATALLEPPSHPDAPPANPPHHAPMPGGHRPAR